MRFLFIQLFDVSYRVNLKEMSLSETSHFVSGKDKRFPDGFQSFVLQKNATFWGRGDVVLP
jgi:hypothetical protein